MDKGAQTTAVCENVDTQHWSAYVEKLSGLKIYLKVYLESMSTHRSTINHTNFIGKVSWSSYH